MKLKKISRQLSKIFPINNLEIISKILSDIKILLKISSKIYKEIFYIFSRNFSTIFFFREPSKMKHLLEDSYENYLKESLEKFFEVSLSSRRNP